MQKGFYSMVLKSETEINCEKCIHKDVCYMLEICNNIEEQIAEFGCEHFIPVVDKSIILKI